LSDCRRMLLRTPLLVLGPVLAAACTPTVAVEAPKEPITINLNIKLDANVRLQVEEKAKQDVASKSIF
jgi:YnbE-like lipoprotein